MLNEQGFNLWADGYDRSVGLSDEGNTYPFAGYKRVLNAIYNAVLANGCQTVLDIGFGTGTLTQKLYEHGCTVYGQDFSQRMIELAKVKMPKAELYQGDFTKGLVETLKQNRYDAIGRDLFPAPPDGRGKGRFHRKSAPAAERRRQNLYRRRGVP